MTTTQWHIDPKTLTLEGGTRRSMSGAEWNEQIWPDCPVCGTRVDVSQIDVTSCADFYGSFIARRYLAGYWECPNECDPRPVLWGEDWKERRNADPT